MLTNFEIILNKKIKIKKYNIMNKENPNFEQFLDDLDTKDDTFDKINKIIKEANFKLNINEEYLYYKESNSDIVINFEYLIKLKNEIKLKLKHKNTTKEEKKDLLEKKIDKLLFFEELVSNLEKIYDKINILRRKGCTLPITIEIKIQYPKIEYYLKKLDTFTEINKYLSEVKNDYEKQLNTIYKTEKYLTFLYGNLFTKLINHLNRNFEILEIERYILNKIDYNDIIKDGDLNYSLTTNDYVNEYKLYNNNLFKNINNYIISLFNNNKKNLTNHYEEILIKEKNEYKGIYLDKCENISKEEYIINLFYEKTGKLPIAQNILFCNKETSIEEIQSFLYRAILCDYHTLFIVEINESVSYVQFNEIQNYINESLSYISEKYEQKNNIKNIDKLNAKNYISSCLVFIYDNDLKNESILDKLELFDADDISESFDNMQNIPIKFNNIKVISSDVCGLGKTHKIKKMIKEENKKYYHFPLGGYITKTIIYNKLANLFKKIKDNENKNKIINYNNIAIHIDLFESEDITLINEFLFSVLITKFYINNGNIIYIPNNLKIYIEIPNCFEHYLKKIGILNIFNIENIVLGELKSNEQKNIANIKMDKLELEPELKNIFKKLFEYDNDKQIEEFIQNNIGIKEYSYYQVHIFIKLFISQFGKFDRKLKFLDSHQNDITNEILKEFDESSKYFTNGGFAQLLKKGQYNLNKFDLCLSAYKTDLQKLEYKSPLIFIDEKTKKFHFLGAKNEVIKSNIKQSDKDISYKYLKKLKELLNIPNDIEKDIDGKKSLLSILREHDYIITADIFNKMMLLIYRIKANIPVIMMGETGSGKITLVKNLNQILNNGEEILEIINIYPSINDEMIYMHMRELNRRAKNTKKELWILIDEINTCLSFTLLTEIFNNRTFNGEKLEDNIRLIGACNPYRRKKIILENNALAREDLNEDDYLIYKVKQLPQSLLYYVFSFGSLADEDEKIYVYTITQKIFDKKETKLHEITVELIAECFKFLRYYYDEPTIVSLRELKRFNKFVEFFEVYFMKKNDENEINDDKKILYKIKSIICSLYCCFYIKIINNEKRVVFDIKLRNILLKLVNAYSEEKNNNEQDFEKIKDFKDYIKYEPLKNEIIKHDINNFSDFLKIEEEFLLKQIELDEGLNHLFICKNNILKENLFFSFLSIITGIPLIMIGKPGTSKNLAVELIFNSMKGEYSKNSFFKKYPKIFQFYFRGSKTTTPEEIFNLFKSSENFNKKTINNNKSNEDLAPIYLILFDNLGLAAQSPNKPLNALYCHLEYNGFEEGLSFIGISNYYIDKINRALILSVPNLENDLNEIKYTCKSIVESISPELIKNENYNIFEIISTAYYNYKKFLFLIKKLMTFKIFMKLKKNSKQYFKEIENEQDFKYLLIKEKKINIDFHGIIDFYNLIKNIALESSRLNSFSDENIIIPIIETYIERNFGGINYEIDINNKFIDIEIKNEITRILGEETKKIIKINSVYLFKKIYNNICKEKIYEKYQINNLNLVKYNIIRCLIDNINDYNNRFLLLNINPNISKFIYQTLRYLNPDKKIIIMKGSPYPDDINKDYNFVKINEIINYLESDIILILQNIDQILPYLSDLFDMKYKKINKQTYVRIYTDDSEGQYVHVNEFFKLIILVDKINLFDIPFLSKFEKMKINFNDLLNGEQKLLSKKIVNNIDLRESFPKMRKINYDLKELLINCGYEDIAGLVYIFSLTENKKSEIEIDKNIYTKLSDILPQDIISILDEKNILKQTYYKEKKYYNLKTYLQDLESHKVENKISVIYTFNNIGTIIDGFSKEMEFRISEIKSENQLKITIDGVKIRNKSNEKNNRNIIMIHCEEIDIYKIEYLFDFINCYYKDDNYFYIFVIHIKRNFHSEKNYPKHSSIPFNNPDIKQLFIDNLNGNLDISLEKLLKNNLKDILFGLQVFDLEIEINKSLSNILDDKYNNEKIKSYIQKDNDFKDDLIEKVKDLIEKSETMKKDCQTLIDKMLMSNIINEYTIDIVSCFMNYIKENIVIKNLKSILLSFKKNEQFDKLVDIKNVENSKGEEIKNLKNKILSEIKIKEIKFKEENEENKEKQKSNILSDSEESFEEENSEKSD